MTEPGTLKILVINWQDISNPLAGGAEVHLHEVFERLAARGHSVTLFCHRHKGSADEEMKNGIRIIRKGGRFFFNFHVPFAYFTRFKRERYDVVVDDVNKIPFFTPIFMSEPIQGVTHHLFGKSIFLEAAFPLALYVHLAEKLIKQVYKKVHFIIGSPSTHREYLEWGFPPEQVSIINYCVNTKTYYPADTDNHDPDRICYFGRLKKYKSVDQLLQAFSLLKDDFPKLTVDIIGDGDDRERLQALSTEMGISDRVHFLGFVDEDKKAPLLQKMNFVVNTSSKEGWGLTVVESNACGTPVIAANVPGLRDSVIDGKTGILYEYGAVTELAEKMRSLLSHPEQRERLRENALEWAASFDWEIAATETLEFITRTIDRKARFRKP